MNPTTKRWMLVPIVLTIILALITLGFAAMSTSATFSMPNWVPQVFFACAFVLIIWLVVYLICSRNEDVKLRRKRRAIADRLGEFYLSGEDIKNRFTAKDFGDDAIATTREWSQSVKDYFTANPNELGVAR